MTDFNSIKNSSLVERVKNILMSPKTEWDRIEAEPFDLSKLLSGYVLILAAIGPICSTIGSILFPIGIMGIYYHRPIVSVLVMGVVSYAMSVLAVFVFAWVINFLAPNFGATKDQGQSTKLAAYTGTAGWLVGVFGLFPALLPLSILGLYSLYLLFLGVPKLMKAPADKALSYTAVIVVVMIVVFFVISIVLFPIEAMIGMGGAPAFGHYSASTADGQVQVNGATVDLAKVAAAGRVLEAQSQAQAQAVTTAAASGGAALVPGAAAAAGLSQDQLKSFLPAEIAGYARTESSSSSAGAAGLGATKADAEYAKGNAQITLGITDMASLAGLGSMAAAMNVNSDKETATGYERVSTVNGRVTTEEYDRNSKSGKYSVLLNGRIAVEADGTNVSIDDLKAAVDATGPDHLDAMTHHS